MEIAIAYVDDEKFVILEKQNDIIAQKEIELPMDYVAYEDFDKDVMLAAHVSLCRS